MVLIEMSTPHSSVTSIYNTVTSIYNIDLSCTVWPLYTRQIEQLEAVCAILLHPLLQAHTEDFNKRRKNIIVGFDFTYSELNVFFHMSKRSSRTRVFN